MEERNCKYCIWRTDDGCCSWECDYVSRAEANKIIKERSWVPVSERLPKDDDLHLVTLYDNSGDTPYIYVSVGWHIFGEDKWIVDNELHYNVTAWMENPEPYKEVDNA